MNAFSSNPYDSEPPANPLTLALAKRDDTCAYCGYPILKGEVIALETDAPPQCEACIESEYPGEARFFKMNQARQ